MWNLFMSLFSSHSSAWHAGNDAYYAGKAATSNPYAAGTESFEDWEDGYYGR